VGEVDAGDAFVVGGEGDGDVRGHVGVEGMGFALDAEDDVVGGEVDFDHDVFGGHLLEEGGGGMFVEDVDAVADTLGMAEVDGFADMEAEAFGRHHAGGKLAGVKRDADVGVNGVEVVEHLHLEVVVLHGDAVVFGLDEVDADEVGVGGGDFKAEEGLGEDLLERKGSEDLIEEVDFDGAAGSGGGSIAVLEVVADGFGFGDVFAIVGDFIAEASGEELCAKLGEVGVVAAGGGVPADLVAEGGGFGEGRRSHDLEILLVLGGGARGDFVEPSAAIVFEATEAVEGGEELVVTADAGAGDETAHGEGVDKSVVEVLVFEDGGGGDGGRDAGCGAISSGGWNELEQGGVNTKALGDGFGDEGFCVDGAGEMHMEIGALGHGFEQGVEFTGAHAFGGVEGRGETGFAGCGRGLRDGRKRCAEKKSECNTCLDHAALPVHGSRVSQEYRRKRVGLARGGGGCYTVDRRSRRRHRSMVPYFPPLYRQAKRNARTERANLAACWEARESETLPRPDSSVVERGPEKAGVGGSIPSLATTLYST
jgi:hypothetical protein